MKRIFICAVFFAFLCFDSLKAQENMSLDNALKNSGAYFAGIMPAGSTAVVLNFNSDYEPLAEYIIEELTMHLVNNRNLTVVDRRNLDMLRKEMDLQLSGDVSDESAQAIGKMLGAQTIVSGAIVPLGDVYRLRVRAIAVETAAILGVQHYNVVPDNTFLALTGIPQNVSSAPPARNDNKFALGGKTVFALGVAGMFGKRNVSADDFEKYFFYGGDATLTLYERYFHNVPFAPSLFATVGFSVDESHVESLLTLGGGALVKWRLVNDRLIISAGLSLERLTGMLIDYRREVSSVFGMGFRAGLSYRFTPYISLDLNFDGKYGFEPIQYYSTPYDLFTYGVKLGPTIMFPLDL